VAFDALEFSEAMATIDVGYDLAFLLMDLDIHAGRAAANQVLNRYVARTGDVALLHGLPLFLSMRALVRAHVACNAGRDWADYLDYAEAVLRPAAPVVLGIGGLPGAGKSTLARALAPRLGAAPGALVLRSDEARKRRFGLAPEQRLPPEAYDEAVSRAVMATIFAGVAEAASAGHAVIADLTFLSLEDRAAVARAAGNTPFVGIWLQAPLATLEARVAARHGDASDADVAVLRRLAAHDPGAGSWLAVDATDPLALDVLASHVTKAVTLC
jgi:predicted kinase